MLQEILDGSIMMYLWKVGFDDGNESYVRTWFALSKWNIEKIACHSDITNKSQYLAQYQEMNPCIPIPMVVFTAGLGRRFGETSFFIIIAGFNFNGWIPFMQLRPIKGIWCENFMHFGRHNEFLLLKFRAKLIRIQLIHMTFQVLMRWYFSCLLPWHVACFF